MTTQETCSTPDRGWMGDTRRGASMGRASRPADEETGERFHLRRVHLNSGGYDAGGAYWGIGGTLYEAIGTESDAFMTLRIYRADVTAAFERRGGAQIGTPEYARFRQRWPQWGRLATHYAAQDIVRETYPNARFFV